VTQFGDLRAIPVVEVLARAKDLHIGDAGVFDPGEHRGRQAMINEEVRRQCVLHAGI
jgi:hypothetical protein